MKKSYITPETLTTHVQTTGSLLQESLTFGGTVHDPNSIGFTKENTQPSAYSVWDDDWSQ